MGSSFQNYAQNPTSQKEGKSSASLEEKVEKKKKRGTNISKTLRLYTLK